MSLAGTRGLIRISLNPECELQTAMVLDRVREPEFYKEVTGETFPGEYGERVSARRRGVMFENNLHKDNAALLRQALGPMFGLDPNNMRVRNLIEEVPENDLAGRIKRLDLTRSIFRDLAEGRPVPDLLIQPQLQIITGSGANDFDHIAPDFMIFDPSARVFVIGEEKSFIVRNGVGEPADLDRTRRQAAVQVIALRAEMASLGIAERVLNRAVFVFASPHGLHPARPVEEKNLDAEVFEVTRALCVLAESRERLANRRNHRTIPLPVIANELSTSFRDACMGMCVMVSYCKALAGDTARVLGNSAADLLGPDTDLTRVSELLAGASPTNTREAMLAEYLLDAARALSFVDASEGSIA
ncbi:MAG: hypothetical protein AB1489_12465 [Acidobacteriota bacterium]